MANEVTFWQNQDSNGPRLRYVNFEVGECVNMRRKWPYDANWMDTQGICMEIWTEDDCCGEVMYFRSKPSAYSNLSSLRVHSFKTCQAKKYSETLVRAALDEHRVEHRFWQVCFRVLGFERQYEERVNKQGRYIDWSFVLPTAQPLSKRQQYIKLIQEVTRRFRSFSLNKLTTTDYCLNDFKLVCHLAAKVLQSRLKQILGYPQDDPKYRIHLQIIDMWECLNRTVKGAHDHLHRYLTKQKWDARKSLEKLPGFKVFLRIILPKDYQALQ